MLHVQNFCFFMFSLPSPSPLLLLPCMCSQTCMRLVCTMPLSGFVECSAVHEVRDFNDPLREILSDSSFVWFLFFRNVLIS